MFRKLPPLHALAAFEAVARHQSFARAAEELHLTHSAVSHRIRQLENALDTQLFLRLNRSIVLTSAGAGFLESVRDILHRLQEASARVASGGRSPVRASVAPGLASEWLARRITDFQSRHPDIELEIQSSSQMVNLRSTQADVGIRFGDGQWKSYHCVKLLAGELFPVCSPAYLEKHGPIRVPQALAHATLLRNALLPWKEWFEAAGLDWDEPTKGPLFSDVNLLIDAAAAGVGVALTIHVLALPGLESGRLVRVLEVSALPKRAYYAVCLPQKLERPEVRIFMDWLSAQAKRALR